jgi:low affinity Fe/Cu permease
MCLQSTRLKLTRIDERIEFIVRSRALAQNKERKVVGIMPQEREKTIKEKRRSKDTLASQINTAFAIH